MKKYNKVLMTLHWVVALIAMTMLALSFFLEDLPKTIRPTSIMLHKSFGLTVLFLMLIRLVWIIKTGRPRLPTAMLRWEIYLARSVQAGLYFFLIAMAMSGWIMSTLSGHSPIWFSILPLSLPGLAPNPALADQFFQVHQVIAWILIVLVGLHIIGALKHALIDKDKVMDSMLP